MAGILFIISAPSGSGKSTLVARLRETVPNLEFSISYTTREKRGSERDGIEYNFITRGEFEQLICEDAFLEHAEVFGNYYGTARHFLSDAERDGKDLLLDIDVQGAAQLRQKLPAAVSIFVLPPDRPTLENRLRRRSQAEHVVDQGIIRRRLEKARDEIGSYPDYDYILVNDKLDDAVDELEAVVWSERLERHSPDSIALSETEVQRYRSMAQRCRLGHNDRVAPVLRSFAIVNTKGNINGDG
ncbi:MAG: guanylate kinase [Acidobacteriaceae bacterium]